MKLKILLFSHVYFWVSACVFVCVCTVIKYVCGACM